MKNIYVILICLAVIGLLLSLYVYLSGKSMGGWIVLDYRAFIIMAILTFLISYSSLSFLAVYFDFYINNILLYIAMAIISILITISMAALGVYDWIDFTFFK
jgi:hypothetical protein